MADSNSNTPHSKAMRAETATNHRRSILAKGGHEVRALIDADQNTKYQAILSYYRSIDEEATQREIIGQMIERDYDKLPAYAKDDQLKLL